MSDFQVKVDGKGLHALADYAKRAGTESIWMEIALEWIDQAEAEIYKLKGGKDEINNPDRQ